MIDKLTKREDVLLDAKRSLNNLFNCYPSFINHTINDARNLIIEELNKTSQEIENIRSSCNHNFQYVGHSHNDDAYECTICGETDWR